MTGTSQPALASEFFEIPIATQQLPRMEYFAGKFFAFNILAGFEADWEFVTY
jgi:hypothetical protein